MFLFLVDMCQLSLDIKDTQIFFFRRITLTLTEGTLEGQLRWAPDSLI